MPCAYPGPVWRVSGGAFASRAGAAKSAADLPAVMREGQSNRLRVRGLLVTARSIMRKARRRADAGMATADPPAGSAADIHLRRRKHWSGKGAGAPTSHLLRARDRDRRA
jgi:hypothetical protein